MMMIFSRKRAELVLLPEKNHSHARDGRWRRTAQIMGFEQEVHVGSELNTFTRRHGQETVVVQDRIQRFNPFRINITITDDPRLNFFERRASSTER